VCFFAILFSYFRLGVYPFGNLSVLFADQEITFYPFIQEFNTRLSDVKNFYFSFNGGFGYDFYFNLIFMMVDPFIIIHQLFGLKGITETAAVTLLLKAPLIAVTFAYFLLKRFNCKNIVILALSITYCFSSLFICFRWCDAFWLSWAMIPLVAVGINNIINYNKFKLYVIALSFAIIFSVNIGIFVCLFSILYYISEIIGDNKLFFNKNYLFTYAISSFAALLLAGFILIPGVILVNYSVYSHLGQNIPTFSYFHSLPRMLSGMLYGVNDFRTIYSNSSPSIYIGILPILFSLLFFINKNISRKRKICLGLIQLFLLLSCSISILSWGINLGRFPNGLPHRYMFIFNFFIIMMAAETFINFNYLKTKVITIISSILTGVIFLLLLLAQNINPELVNTIIAVNLALIISYTIILRIISSPERTSDREYKCVFFLLCGLMILEIYKSAFPFFSGFNRASYVVNDYSEMKLISEHLNTADGTDFYRADSVLKNKIFTGRLYNYKTISTFQITYSSLTNTLQKMGEVASINIISYSATNPLLNALFAVKYIIKKNDASNPNVLPQYFDEYLKLHNYSLLKNEKVLPVGFMLHKMASDFSVTNYSLSNTTHYLNDLVKYSTNIEKQMFSDLIFPSKIKDQYLLTAKFEETNGYISVTPENKNKLVCDASKIKFEFVAKEANPATIILNLPNYQIIALVTQINNRVFRYFPNLSSIAPVVANLKDVKKGDVISVEAFINDDLVNNGSIVSDKYKTSILYFLGVYDVLAKFSKKYRQPKEDTLYAYMYQTDYKIFEEVYDKLNQQTLTNISYDDTRINGDIAVKEDGVLFFSIPFDKRWHLYANGEKISTFAVLDTFIGAQLKEGNYKINLVYNQSISVYIGIAVSIFTLIAIFVADRYLKKRNFYRNEGGGAI
jgi:uncharacterized membrane protein YfhO